MIPGGIVTPEASSTLSAGREAITMTIENTGDRPIQVGSHYAIARESRARLSIALRRRRPR